MSLFKDQLYFLTEEDGRCLQVVNGVVTSLANRKPLDDTPMGWLDILVSWELDMRQGLLRSMATPLEFVWDGAQIVGHIAINENMERKIFLLIKKFTPIVTDTTIDPLYRFLYRGELDLSSIEIGDYSTQCSIMEGGIYKLLKANAGTTSEYPFDDESIFVKMDGMFLNETDNFIIQEALGLDLAGVEPHLPGIIFTVREGQAAGVATFSVYFNSEAPTDFNNSVDYFLSTAFPITGMKFSGEMNFNVTGGTYKLYLKTNKGRTISIIDQAVVAGLNIIPFDVTFDAQENENFFLIAEYDSGLVSHVINYHESSVKLTFSSRYPTTYSRAYRPFDLYRRIVNKTLKEGVLLPGVYNAASSALLQANSNLAVTCGDANRGIEGARIKTHLNDFFDAFNAILSARMQVIGDKLVLEGKEYFFDASDPYHLGECKDLKATFANDIRGNVVKIGYPKQNIEDASGRYAFNNTSIFSSTISRVVKNIELISPYLTDPFYIEINRLNLDGKTTTDSNSDNDVMILNVGDQVGPSSQELFGGFDASENKIGISVTDLELVKGQKIKITGGANDGKILTILSYQNVPLIGSFIFVDGPVIDEIGINFTIEIVSGLVHELKRVTYDNGGNPDDFGLPSPETAFNIEQLTPKRMLQANGPFIRSLFWQFDNQELTFNTTEVNGNLKTVTGGITIREGDNQSIMALGSPLFKPVNLEFEIDVPVDLVEILEANPRKSFSVDWKGTRYVGFLRKAAIAPSTRESQSFTLLSAPFNDLSKLVIQ